MEPAQRNIHDKPQNRQQNQPLRQLIPLFSPALFLFPEIFLRIQHPAVTLHKRLESLVVHIKFILVRVLHHRRCGHRISDGSLVHPPHTQIVDTGHIRLQPGLIASRRRGAQLLGSGIALRIGIHRLHPSLLTIVQSAIGDIRNASRRKHIHGIFADVDIARAVIDNAFPKLYIVRLSRETAGPLVGHIRVPRHGMAQAVLHHRQHRIILL